MSDEVLDEPRIQDIIDALRMPIKCRIPRSLRLERRGLVNKTKVNNADLRQKSNSHGKIEKTQTNDATRSVWSDRDKAASGSKKHGVTSKRVSNDNQKSKVGSSVIMVPVQQKPVRMLYSFKSSGGLPDQNTINKYEELELQRSDQSNEVLGYAYQSDTDEVKSGKKPTLEDIVYEWKRKNKEFEKMKNDLNKRQTSILDYYASLSVFHQKMIAAGQSADLPLTEDLNIMNVAKMTPEQLLKLCAESSKLKDNLHDELTADNKAVVDKLYNMPAKLAATCERALAVKKEIIEWLDCLKSEVSDPSLSQKIKELNSENEKLTLALKNNKNECLTDLQAVENYIRQKVNDTMALHLQFETLTYKLSELNSHNADLQKQLTNAENLRSHSNRNKMTEIEKEFKEKQKCMKDRLSKAEGQVRIGAERACQLEAALDRANFELDTKVAMIRQLQDQNESLKRNFDGELKKLDASILEHTANLEQIAQDREKLQIEKNELEKQINNIKMFYNIELQESILKLSETEKKYSIEVEEKKKQESVYSKQLMETELYNHELLQKLEEMESRIANTNKLEQENDKLKNELEQERLETEHFKNMLSQQTETIREMEAFPEENQILNNNLVNQQQLITELTNREELLKTQLRDSEAKMEFYEKELMQLKDRIAQLQEQFGGLNDINELNETIKKQREELLTVTNQNRELSETLERNIAELNECSKTNKIQKQRFQEKEDLIKTLIKSEEEQCIIIKQLRNNLEVRDTTDSEVCKELEKKKLEIESLVNNAKTRKQQILQLEKIILTLEDKVRRAYLLRKKYEEKVHSLETKIEIYESYRYKQGVEATSKNINQFLKLLEEEMESPNESQDIKGEVLPEMTKNNIADCGNVHELSRQETQPLNSFDHRRLLKKHSLHESLDKKSFVSCNCDLFNGDHIDKNKDSNLKLDKGYYLPCQEGKTFAQDNTNQDVKSKIAAQFQEKIRNSLAFTHSRSQLEKKQKMFALAGHRL